MYVQVPLEIFSDIQRNAGSVQCVTYSMATFVSVITPHAEHGGMKVYKKHFSKILLFSLKLS